MQSTNTFCLFNEGLVVLPDGYTDRTINVLVPQGAAPSFNISRDEMQENDTITAYIDKQLNLMEKHLKGWKQTERKTCALGEELIQGECVHASYINEGKRIWQQQAVFNTHERHILVFSMTSAAKLSESDSLTYETLLKNFRFHSSK